MYTHTKKKGTRRQHLALKICERCYKSCIHTTNVFIERHFVHRQIEHAQSAQNGDEGQFERQGALSGKTERHRCARHHERKVRGDPDAHDGGVRVQLLRQRPRLRAPREAAAGVAAAGRPAGRGWPT